MQKFTQIIGARVISAHNCEYLGTVINMQMNNQNTQIKHLILSGADDETTYILPIKRIFAINDAVIVRNKTALSVTAESKFPNLINATAITLSGNDYGRIVDMELDEKFKITNILTNDKSISPTKVVSFSNGIALINDTDKKYTNGSFAPHIQINNNQNNVNIVSALEQNETSYVATPRTIIARLPKNFKSPK